MDDHQEFDLSLLEKKLLDGVRRDPIARAVYSVDSSILEIAPLAIVTPRDQRELKLIVDFAIERKLSLHPRGAATGIAGGCLGKGLIIDCSRYLTKILAFDPLERTITVEPGVTQRQLNEAVAPYGLRLGPDTSTGNRATIGGMVANNSAGAHSLRYGSMIDVLLGVKLWSSQGEIDLSQTMGEEPLSQALHRLVEENKTLIEKIPALHRNASGYLLRSQLHGVQPVKLLAGAEGTLGVMGTITLKLDPLPRDVIGMVVACPSREIAFELSASLHDLSLFALELIDGKILDVGYERYPLLRRCLGEHRREKAFLYIEVEGESTTLLQEIETIVSRFLTQAVCFFPLDEEERRMFYSLREASLGILLAKKSYTRAVAFIEDLSVPKEQALSLHQKLTTLFHSYDLPFAIYGHIGASCLHVRPYLDLRSPKDLHIMEEITQKTIQIIRALGGVLSGEHGDGLLRAGLQEELFGKEIVDLFRAVKMLFDPLNIMNPGKIVGKTFQPEELRLNPSLREKEYSPTFFTKNDLHLDFDLCNGNGNCRKKEGLMCPSFHATNDEMMTTRARAQAFRSLLFGRIDETALNSAEMEALFEYCIECKGCKKECPSSIDLARLKAELLHRRRKKGIHKLPLSDLIFSNLPTLLQVAHFLHPLMNILSQNSFAKRFLPLFGITKERELPRLQSERFTSWSKKNPSSRYKRRFALFVDCYSEFIDSSAIKAFYQLLQDCGITPIVDHHLCCGRPLISKGDLDGATILAEKIAARFAESDCEEIVVFEPSCLSALTDDHSHLLRRQLIQPKSGEMILSLLQAEGTIAFTKKEQETTLLFHPHCHERVLFNPKMTLQLLDHCGYHSSIVTEGCCGMAGSFGYEKNHYDFSLAIANTTLRNLHQEKEQLITASGFSCRSQISHLHHHKIVSPLELLLKYARAI